MKDFLKYSFITVMVFVLLSAACLADQTDVAASQALLTVEVTNGTANGSTITDNVVTVRIYKGGQLLRTLDGKVNINGKTIFENVPTGDDNTAVASVMHQEMRFSGHPVALKQEQDVVSAHVQVFDVSQDKSKLSVGTHHFIIHARSDFLQITEYMQLKNSSDMAVSPAQRDSQNRAIVLEIMLPDGFKDLRSSSYFEQGALVVTEEGFYDTMAVPPGEFSLSFSYTIDIVSDTMDIVKKISLPTSDFMVFAELGRAELQGLGQANQFAGTNGVPMQYYKRSSLAPTEEIAFQITGFNVNASNLDTWMILAVVFGAVVILVILRLTRKKLIPETSKTLEF